LDPLSGALLAFGAIKKGISIGKDLSSMSKDINNLFEFIDGTKAANKSKSDPLNDFILKKKAEDFERDLRDVIISARGMKAYDEFVSMRKKSAEAHRASKYAAMARRNKIIQVLSILAGIAIFLGSIVGMIYFASLYA
tara:strand:- start:3298 stop:3711 length:414 start_codon:yes stop_codon:yes gene_type:complete